MVAVKNEALEQATGAFIEELMAQGGKPLYQMTPAEARGVLEKVQSSPVDRPEVEIEDKTFPVGPQISVSVRIFRPAGAKAPLPVVLYIHGGGWILGSMNTHDRLVREICVGANVAVVFVNYSRSPEAKYPTALEECYAALKYVVEQGKSLNLNASKLAVVGDSVGGNMTIATTLLAKERKGPKIDFQVLLYPVTSSEMNTSSYTEFQEGPWLTKKAMEWFWNAYEPDAQARKNPLLSPLNASQDQLKGLPPALLIVDENDVLRDEGEAFAHRLMQAGVKVTALRMLGTIHDFTMLNPLANTPAVRSAIALTNTYLQHALYHGR